MWVVSLILILTYLIVGIISHLCNIAKFLIERENEKEQEENTKYKPNKYKLEE